MKRLTVVRRCGTSPAERGSATGQTCPDVLFLLNGSFYVIGFKEKMPASELKRYGASIGPNEAGVVVPGNVMRGAARDIVSQQPTKT